VIDVVYPLSNNSKFRDDFELRYSLRSLMLQNWVGKIFLIGHCPEWAKDVVHIPCGDPYVNCKDANIINKILLACSIKELSENFLINSDDQYLLKAIGIDELEPMIENPCRLDEFKRKAGHNSWQGRVVDTVQWCSKNGYPDWIFQSHTPYLATKTDYPEAMSKVAWGKGNGFTTHIYLNIAYTQAPKEPKGRTVRIKGRILHDELYRLIEHATFFNHNDSGLIPVVKTFLEEYFPVKSRWEK